MAFRLARSTSSMDDRSVLGDTQEAIRPRLRNFSSSSTAAWSLSVLSAQSPSSQLSRRRSSSKTANDTDESSLTPAEVHRDAYLRLQNSFAKPYNQEPPSEGSSSSITAPGSRAPLPPVATSECLQNFVDVIRRKLDPLVDKQDRKRKEEQAKSRKERERHRDTLRHLRNWHKKQKMAGLFNWRSLWGTSVSDEPPGEQDLMDMIQYYYPYRAKLQVYICDFGDGRFSKKKVDLGEVDAELRKKPDWADVRWIHAPLNFDLVHSSLEDRFLKRRRNLDRTDAYHGNINWPYFQTETVSIYKYDDLVDMQDAYRIVSEHSKHPRFLSVQSKLTNCALGGIGKELRDDIEWRSGHLGLPQPITHWDLALGDFPRQLSNTSADWTDPNINYAKVGIEKQTLSGCKLFQDAQLVRSKFRCFHSTDGFLLTMCGGHGIDYIDSALNDRLGYPSETNFEDEDGSSIGLMFKLFSESGSSTWGKPRVNWFLIYLLTEIVAKPNNIRQGCSAPSLMDAYRNIVQTLKDTRYDKFERGESPKRVRAYLTCTDELTSLDTIWQRNLILLDDLSVRAKALGGDDSVDGDEAVNSALDRITWARRIVEDNKIATQEILLDLQKSRDALFQLRSIEQNELAIVADSQNEAILIFTGVTIVFLPLSFFTSYFGMNLQGIANTARTEIYFWELCGSTAAIIVLLIILYVFRTRVTQRLKRYLGVDFESRGMSAV